MLPWGHAAFGYILYSLYARYDTGYPPIGLAVFAVGFGTQFPDLIDKPLTWTIPLLPYGRSFAHSLFTFTAIVVILWLVVEHADQYVLVVAFAIGYLSHLIGDAFGPILSGELHGLGYLLWPLTSVPSGGTRSFVEFFLSLEFTPSLLFGLIVTLLGVGLWVYDGLPGVVDLAREYSR